jgi:hypothetical protein
VPGPADLAVITAAKNLCGYVMEVTQNAGKHRVAGAVTRVFASCR